MNLKNTILTGVISFVIMAAVFVGVLYAQDLDSLESTYSATWSRAYQKKVVGLPETANVPLVFWKVYDIDIARITGAAGTYDTTIDIPSNAVITEAYVDETGKGICTFEILDTPSGRILNTILRAGSKLHVSTRAFGDVSNETKVKDGKKIETTTINTRWTGAPKNSEDQIRIAVLGGSSTFCTGVTDADSWPAQLQSIVCRKQL